MQNEINLSLVQGSDKKVLLSLPIDVLATLEATSTNFYNVKFDLIKNQLVVDTGAGVDVRINIASQGVDLGKLGSLQVAVDAASLEALAQGKLTFTSTRVSATASASAGVMGPSASASYDTGECNVLGLTFQIKWTGTVGVGAKVSAGAGITGDSSAAKLKASMSLGLYCGPGGCTRTDIEIGVDPLICAAASDLMREAAMREAEREERDQAAEAEAARLLCSGIQQGCQAIVNGVAHIVDAAATGVTEAAEAINRVMPRPSAPVIEKPRSAAVRDINTGMHLYRSNSSRSAASVSCASQSQSVTPAALKAKK